jgi:ferredoxin
MSNGDARSAADGEPPELVVNRDMCEAHARCVDIAPDIFELDDDDVLHIHKPRPGPDDEIRARRAVRSCPKTALSLTPTRR